MLRISTTINSTRSHTSCSIFMLNTSTQKHFLNVFVMFVSTDNLAHYLKVSKYQIGQPLKNNTAGKLMSTLAMLGITQCTICILNGLLCNSQETVKNQTFFNGSVLNNLVAVLEAVSSTMKFLNYQEENLGGEMVVITSKMKMMIVKLTANYGHSLMLINKETSFLA